MSRATCPVSVIIPAYNAERFLRRAVESVLGQTTCPQEIIVVDDGSTDGTSDVARSFGDRLCCLRQDNAGVATARNRGIGAAEGEWIAFLDADDHWLPCHLEKCWEVIEADPSLRWCCGAYRRVDGDGMDCPTRSRRPREPSGPCASSVTFLDAWIAGAAIISSGMMVRRDVLQTLGMFDTDLRLGEDGDLWYRIALPHPRMGFVWPPTVLYVQNEGSLTARAHDVTDLLLAGLARNVNRAARLEGGARTSFHKLLRHLARDALRHSLNRGRWDVLRRLSGEFGWLLSPGGRLIAWCGSHTPSSLLRGVGTARRWIVGGPGRR